jgi:dihydrofolate reductase
MTTVVVRNFSVSLDGFGAGPEQSIEAPIGVNGSRLHEWIWPTRFGRAMLGEEGGEDGIDNSFLAQGDENVGATIMGRNMFGPVRGAWSGDSWKGWWGDNPPYHHPVFVLTHHPRASFAMEGGTTFHFVTSGIEEALRQATEAAGDQDVRIGGGAATVQQYLHAGLVDNVHLVIVPVILGRGERTFDASWDGYECAALSSSPAVAHVELSRK